MHVAVKKMPKLAPLPANVALKLTSPTALLGLNDQ